MESVKKKARITSEEDEEDRISRLPDDLLHQIMKFLDTKLSVQTSALSKRWKLVWTSLPFLKFKWDQRFSAKNTTKLTRNVLARRNHESQIFRLDMTLLPRGLMVKFIEYAISHRVKYLNVRFRPDQKPIKLSKFNSNTIKELNLEVKLVDFVSEPDCWALPALSNLSLIRHVTYRFYNYDFVKLPESYLTCLAALRNLLVEGWDLESFAFSFPELTSLVLRKCILPKKVWDLPAITSLTLDFVRFPENMNDLFASLVNLQHLKLYFNMISLHNCFIHCPALVSLEIQTRYKRYKRFNTLCANKVVVLAPKLSNFTSVGIFQITFEDSKPDYVNVNLRGWTDEQTLYYWWEELKRCFQQLTIMLPGLGGAKVLTLDLDIIKALHSIPYFLESFPSPFYDLKYVKLPHGCNEESISGTLRTYLLGGSPTATFVTALPQNMIPYTEAATVKAQNMLLKEPGAPNNVSDDSQYKTVLVDSADTGLQEELVLDV